MVNKFAQEFKQEEEIRKLEMNDVADAYSLWRVAAENHWMDKVAFAEEICRDALKYTWGKDAICEFNYQNLQLQCKGTNGAFVLFK